MTRADEQPDGLLARWLDGCLRRRGVVLLAAVAAALLGATALERLPFDAFPDVTPVQVTVNAAAPALGPLEVERRVTVPVEQALLGLPGLTQARSLSRQGLSQVTLVFADGTDLARARQAVSERLAGLEPPAGVERPAPGPPATGLGEVLHVLLTGADAERLRTAHDAVLRPALLAVPGVAEVNAWGGHERTLEVLVDPVRLRDAGLDADDVEAALVRDHGSAGGGLVVRGGEAAAVQGLGLLASPAEAEQVLLAWRDGVPVRVGDAARARWGRAPRTGVVTADGKGEAVLGLGFAVAGEGGRDVARRLEARLAEARPGLPPGVKAEVALSRAALVDDVLATVRLNLAEGALLVVAVLFAFLGDLRAGLVVALAIPLSLLFAFDLMARAGVAGSLMSLGAIDFGLVVDSSLILVENAARRLDEDGGQRPAHEVVRDAALEVRRPTLMGELVILVVYLPLLLLEGVEGKLFRPMALTVVFALLGSMLLSVTVTPALASLALRRRARPRGEGWLTRALKRGYAPLLGLALGRPRAVAAAAALVVGLGFALGARLGTEFVPPLQEGALVINTVRLAGVALDESARVGTTLERALLEQFPDEVERAWTRTGTPEVATDPMGAEVSDLFVTLRPRERWTKARTQAELVERLREALGRFPGQRTIFTQPIAMRVAEMTAGVRADVGVAVLGDDLPALRRLSAQVAAALRGVAGAVDVTEEPATASPVVEVTVDRDACARRGVAAGEVLEAVERLGGRRLGEVQDGPLRRPLVVRLEERYQADPDALAEVLLPALDGARVPLREVARLEPADGPALIQREWGRRRVVVQANASGRDLGGFVADCRRAVDAAVALPTGYRIAWGGQAEHLERARARLRIVVPAALLLVLALLLLTYGRLADALRVLTGVPLAAVGGVLALWLRGLPLSVSAAVGFVALCGVSVLGDMVLVSTIRQRLAAGLDLRAAVEAAALARLRPVLMTGLVASLGFLPMALNTGIGAEVQRPLATVVIGGVVSSTLLTLVVLPALYLLVARPRARNLTRGIQTTELGVSSPIVTDEPRLP